MQNLNNYLNFNLEEARKLQLQVDEDQNKDYSKVKEYIRYRIYPLSSGQYMVHLHDEEKVLNETKIKSIIFRKLDKPLSKWFFTEYPKLFKIESSQKVESPFIDFEKQIINKKANVKPLDDDVEFLKQQMIDQQNEIDRLNKIINEKNDQQNKINPLDEAVDDPVILPDPPIKTSFQHVIDLSKVKIIPNSKVVVNRSSLRNMKFYEEEDAFVDEPVKPVQPVVERKSNIKLTSAQILSVGFD